jgi:hypothetical protein
VYVAFRLVVSLFDLGLPFEEAYEQVKSLYESKLGEESCRHN